ncbi:transporter [Terrilactibacillus sp. BCM23-1]|uniref:Transporter n=1 Tax=Terrilactibacillus tamarindi TaxID=2599694 RepID=A0A6N8CNJ3_9BACI|nr:transporter [Terrilactibacillus tamarindi]MTT31541.1 transporter [Terrilactibacillus tamarindi]
MRNIRLTFQVAATYIGTIVGAGFASGKEIIQFFTQFGSLGSIGILVSGVIFTWIGTKMLVLAGRIKATSFNELTEYIFGIKIGLIIQALIFFIVFGVTGVMLAGSGAVFQEQWGLSRHFGIALAILLCFILLLKGAKGVMLINSFIVPIMITFSLAIGLYFMMQGQIDPATIWNINKPFHYHWVIHALSYVSFNLITALTVLVPLGQEINNEKVLFYGGAIGGIGFTLMLFVSHIVLLNHPQVLLFEIPIAEVVKHFGPIIHFLYVTIIYGEIFTTFIGNIFGMSRQIQSLSGMEYRKIIVVFLILTCAISQIGYGSLITFLYPLYGYLCMFCLFTLMAVRLPKKGEVRF